MPIKIMPTKGKKKKKKNSSAAPMIMPGQKKMLDKMMGKSKPQTLKGGGELVGGQKKLDKNNDGKITGQDFKLLRSSKGMKKGGKVMKMRGGGMAARGLNFRMR